MSLVYVDTSNVENVRAEELLTSTVRVVIPSLVGEVSQLDAMCGAALRAGASPVVIANSKSLTQQLSRTLIPYLTSGRNDGFAASVKLGSKGDWDWLVILNDDLVFEHEDLAYCLSSNVLNEFDLNTVVHLDNEPARRIPTRAGVLLSVSLIANIGRKLMTRFRAPRPHLSSSFRPFSAVAIGRQAWDRLGGLDTRYPFAYEDADFVRRSDSLGVQVRIVTTGIVHLHSQTGGKFVTTVLPAATWSALEYLTKWFGERTLNRFLLILALVLRAPVAGLTLSEPQQQIRAVFNGIRMLILDERPSLPQWDSL